MKPLDFQISWPSRLAPALDALDATFGHLRLVVADRNITTYVDDDNPRVDCDHVEQPLFYVAEWIAENWWPLLWEPEKRGEDQPGETVPARDDSEFRLRHSLFSAQHGFALPNLSLVPTGVDIHLFAQAYRAEHAGVRFKERADAYGSRELVQDELKRAVNEIVSVLPEGMGTDLRRTWSLISETSDEQAEFCRLIGALGLSPYIAHPEIEGELDRISEKLPSDQLFDLCLTATAEEFVRSSRVAEIIHDATSGGSTVNLDPIRAVPPPGEVKSAPAWRRGSNAAKKLKSSLGIAENDIDGGTKLFDSLTLDWRAKAAVDLNGFASPISGALARQEDRGSVAFVHDAPSSRRFAAARAAFFFWTGGPNEKRLLTSAVTRDQQASRSFAAEMLVPQTYIRAQANRSRVSRDQISAIAERAIVAPEVVLNQAMNAGLQIAR